MTNAFILSSLTVQFFERDKHLDNRKLLFVKLARNGSKSRAKLYARNLFLNSSLAMLFRSFTWTFSQPRFSFSPFFSKLPQTHSCMSQTKQQEKKGFSSLARSSLQPSVVASSVHELPNLSAKQTQTKIAAAVKSPALESSGKREIRPWKYATCVAE